MLREDEREWDAVSASLDVPRARLLLVRQVHGRVVATARRGAGDAWQRPEADAIVTDDPSVAIGVRVADCAPILLFDPVRGVAAAVHAGWRGTAAGVSLAATAKLGDEFGSRPADVLAAIGPCLGRCCGEVGPEVRETFRASGTTEDMLDRWFSPGNGDRLWLDLERANRDQLVLGAGLSPANVFASGLCTKTNRDRLHSYRGDGSGAGRILAAIRTM